MRPRQCRWRRQATGDAKRVLATLRADRHVLDMATYAIGEQPLQVRALRRDLREWLARLDLDTDAPRTGSPSRTLRRFSWSQADGWRLEFTMQQLRPCHRSCTACLAYGNASHWRAASTGRC